MSKILVIDDDAAVRRLVDKALRLEGYEVACADNGLTGAEMARTSVPDLILCDVRMEQLDGYGTLAVLRDNHITNTIPVILMTGQVDYASIRHGMELGADDYLPKPFNVAALSAAVRARLQKQATLRQQAEKRLDQLRVNISYTLPHELRTPLNGIIGAAELIVAEHATLPPSEIAGLASAINTSARRLHRLIENTLLYAQLELSATDAARQETFRHRRTPDAAAVVGNAARRRAEAVGRTADLHLALTPVGVAMGDDHLARLVDELVDNAFKFSNPGAPVHLTLSPSDAGVEFKVVDAGRGLKPEHLAEIGAYMQFERKFYEQQGSGLGLAIARRLAELHGGSLTLESQPGQRTEVRVTLPAASPLDGPSGSR